MFWSAGSTMRSPRSITYGCWRLGQRQEPLPADHRLSLLQPMFCEWRIYGLASLSHYRCIRGTLIMDESDFRFSDERAEIIKILKQRDAKGFRSFAARCLLGSSGLSNRAVIQRCVCSNNFRADTSNALGLNSIVGDTSLRRTGNLGVPVCQNL